MNMDCIDFDEAKAVCGGPVGLRFSSISCHILIVGPPRITPVLSTIYIVDRQFFRLVFY